MQRPWNKPVTVMIGEPPEETVISTTQAASWALIEDWPVDDSPIVTKALTIFTGVMENKRNPEEAREAFVEAATEAGILVQA